MEATIRKEDDSHVTLILDGYLDTSVTQQTEKEVEPLFQYHGCEIVIDCSRLEYISSSTPLWCATSLISNPSRRS